MNSSLPYVNKSIARQFVAIMMGFLFVIFIGALAVLYLNSSTIRESQRIQDELLQKQELIAKIAYHSNQVVFRVRGYYSFQSEFEKNGAFREREQLKAALAEFRKLSLNQKETELVNSVDMFFQDYFAHTLPRAFQMVEQNDYVSLRALAASGVNQSINNLLDYAQSYQHESEALILQENKRLSTTISSLGNGFLIYIFVVLLLAVWVTLRMAKQIGGPLQKLATSADDFANGREVDLPGLNRADEIGQLSRSFQYMFVQIQAKEEELVAQNEELQAQQDELQMQQEELQEALNKMEENERYLEKRNQFVLALSNTLNKQALLNSITQNIVEITGADKGMIVMFNDAGDHAALGVSPEGVRQFLQNMKQGMLVRIQETGKAYVLVREQFESEKGYHLESVQASDMYLPVLNADGQVFACLVLTRLGRPFAPQEVNEATGFAKQISLSLEKQQMFEETAKQRQLTQDMLDTIQEGVQLLDPSGAIVQYNLKVCEILGNMPHEKTEAIKRDAFIRYLQERVQDPDRLTAYIQAVVDGTVRENESLIYEIREPIRRFIQVYFEPLYRDKVRLGTLLVHRDITKEYEVDQMKSEFVSTVSHELRTPLASVLGFTELLLHKELPPERQRKYLTTMHQEAQRLTSLINDFLDLQRMESGRQAYERNPVDLIPLIRETIEVQQVHTALHQIVFQQQTDQAIIMGDKDKIRQVLTNLLSNAMKYSPQGGTVTLMARRSANRVMIDVKDEGLGIPEEALPNLFTKFYRVDNSDRREIGGTGLGLAIVKEILVSHGGEISVSSTFGEGSTFTITLPLRSEQQSFAEAEVAAGEQGDKQSRGKVALIEDDTNLSALLTEELQSSGLDVFRYANGSDALQSMLQIRPDAVVLDILLEGSMDGWEVIEEMKKQKVLDGLPIFISSAFEEREKAAELGARGYLVKPYHPAMLSGAILEAIAEKNLCGHIMVPKMEAIKTETRRAGK